MRNRKLSWTDDLRGVKPHPASSPHIRTSDRKDNWLFVNWFPPFQSHLSLLKYYFKYFYIWQPVCKCISYGNIYFKAKANCLHLCFLKIYKIIFFKLQVFFFSSKHTDAGTHFTENFIFSHPYLSFFHSSLKIKNSHFLNFTKSFFQLLKKKQTPYRNYFKIFSWTSTHIPIFKIHKFSKKKFQNSH